MGRLTKISIAALVSVALASNAAAQTPYSVKATDTAAPVKQEIGGTQTIDVIALRAGAPGAPLRFGNVVPGSERVQLNTKLLVATTDYAIDYTVGVVYLKVAQKVGDQLTVSYRYGSTSSTATTNSTPSLQGLGAFNYNVMPQLSLLMGMGMTERAADGTVISSNVFGWKNSFKTSNGAVNGLFVFGDRNKENVGAGLNMDANAKPGDALKDEGSSKFLVQNFQTRLLGGQANFDFQDISKNFANYSSVSQGGYSAADVQKFQKEKGLTRTGMSFSGMKLGSAAFSNSFRDVKDPSGSITWRSFGMENKGLKVGFNSQKVDSGFQRFKDISETDRDQLLKERGMSRQDFTGSFDQKVGKLGFNSLSIVDDSTGNKINKSETTFGNSALNFKFGEQSVSSGFGKFSNLKNDERNSYGREAGLRRQWMSLSATLTKGGTPLTFADSSFKSDTGKFTARDLAYTGKAWSLEHSERSADAGFTNLGALQDAEMDSHVKSIASMYGPGVATKTQDRSNFLKSQGLSRDYTKLSSRLFKGTDFSVSTLQFKGASDKASLDTLNLTNKKFTASFRRQNLGTQFNELSNMMDFERQKLGTIIGMQRTDLAFNVDLGGNRKLDFSKMMTSMDAGSVNRTLLNYSAKGLSVSAGARDVTNGFSSASSLIESDAEKSLLSTFQGFNERDLSVNWDVKSGLKMQFAMQDAHNSLTSEVRKMTNGLVDWQVDKLTHVKLVSIEQRNNDPLATLFSSSLQQISLARDMGRFGKFEVLESRQTYDGTSNTSLDSMKRYLAYETKIDKLTSVRTEQTSTNFGDGTAESISSNTISRTLAKNAGVSLTDTRINRSGNESDETKRNYGFWYEFQNGLRFSYGYNRQLAGTTNGTMSSTVSLGTNSSQNLAADKMGSIQQGAVGGLMVGGGYGVNTWDSGDRTQSFSNVNVSTAKPLKLAFVDNLKLNFGMDTAADYSTWLKENRLMGFSGNVGKNTFAYEYRSQMATSGSRGIDRSFRFGTEDNAKRLFSGSLFYKVRTLPTDEQFMIRDFSVTARPTSKLSITNQLQTNPEVVKTDVILGTLPQASRSNKWLMNYQQSAQSTIGASWQELINEQNNAKSTTAGINLGLFQKTSSPLTLFYGVEEASGNVAYRLTQRYNLQYSQKSGLSSFSLFLGNVSYEHSIADGQLRNNLTMRLDYQVRF